MVSATQPKAIVLDVMMPVMDGRAFLNRCRADPECDGTPVLVMSAHPKLQETASEFHVVISRSLLIRMSFSVPLGD
jgi:CheY-like chemotaxis protein